MQSHWLNKQNNDKLIIFFAGWSFDYKPFEFLDCKDFDVLMVYDYNNPLSLTLSLGERSALIPSPRERAQLCECNETTTAGEGSYKQTYLIAWSMGVFTAYQLRDELPKFDKKIAINGTPFPVDDEFGIPQKPFLLTLRHAKTGLEGKFYQNIFASQEEFERYIKNPVKRTIENRVEELQSLYDRIKEILKPVQDDKFGYNDAFAYYDKAIVSSNDKIIPTKNQLNFWQDKAEIIESGHFPFYNFKSWNEILCR